MNAPSTTAAPEMAERCDMMLHHGGYGSSQTGLYTGTPSFAIPTYSEHEVYCKFGLGEKVLISKYQGKQI